MNPFRALLAAMWTAVVIYTGVTIAHHGSNLLPVFFGDIGQFSWPGQFDLDFMCLLALSAVWVGWRHRFSPLGLGLAVAAFFFGTLFLTAYLLIASLRARGDLTELLTGGGRSSERKNAP